MIQKIKKIGLIPILVGIYFIGYGILPGLFGKAAASLIKTGLLAAIIILMVMKGKVRSNYRNYDAVLIPAFCFYAILNLAFGYLEIVRWVVNVIGFFVFCKYSNQKTFFALSYSLKIATLLCALSVGYYSLLYGNMAYYRDDALIDKQFLTAFFAMTYFFCIIDIFYNKQRLFNIICLVFFAGLNIFIVQSKTSLLALAMELATLYIFFPHIRKTFRKYLKYVIIVGVIAFLLIPQIRLPQELAFGINHVLGFELIDESYFTRLDSHLVVTFDIREDLRAYCFKLFRQNPIFGVGQGQFAVINGHSNNYFNYLNETESSWLQILVEGGIYYVCVMLYFFLKPMYDIIKKLKHHSNSPQSYFYLMSFSFFMVFIVIYFFNDFADSLFWLSAGIMIAISFGRPYKRTANKKRLKITNRPFMDTKREPTQ